MAPKQSSPVSKSLKGKKQSKEIDPETVLIVEPVSVGPKATKEDMRRWQIERNGIVPETRVNLRSLESSGLDEALLCINVLQEYQLETLMLRLNGWSCPSVVRQFYSTLEVLDFKQGGRTCQVEFGGIHRIFTHQDIADITGVERSRPEGSNLSPWKPHNVKDIVMAWTGGKGSFIPRKQLPLYLQMVHVLLGFNVIPAATHYDIRGIMLETLWRVRLNEWVDWAEVIMLHFVRYFELVKVKNDARAVQGELKFPCLIMALVQHLGWTFSEDMEKEFYDKDTYSIANWLEFKKKSGMMGKKKIEIKPKEKKKGRKPAREEEEEDDSDGEVIAKGLRLSREEIETSVQSDDELIQQVEAYTEEATPQRKKRKVMKRKLVDETSDDDEAIKVPAPKKMKPKKKMKKAEKEKGEEEQVEMTWDEVDARERQEVLEELARNREKLKKLDELMAGRTSSVVVPALPVEIAAPSVTDQNAEKEMVEEELAPEEEEEEENVKNQTEVQAEQVDQSNEELMLEITKLVDQVVEKEKNNAMEVINNENVVELQNEPEIDQGTFPDHEEKEGGGALLEIEEERPDQAVEEMQDDSEDTNEVERTVEEPLPKNLVEEMSSSQAHIVLNDEEEGEEDMFPEHAVAETQLEAEAASGNDPSLPLNISMVINQGMLNLQRQMLEAMNQQSKHQADVLKDYFDTALNWHEKKMGSLYEQELKRIEKEVKSEMRREVKREVNKAVAESERRIKGYIDEKVEYLGGKLEENLREFHTMHNTHVVQPFIKNVMEGTENALKEEIQAVTTNCEEFKDQLMRQSIDSSSAVKLKIQELHTDEAKNTVRIEEIKSTIVMTAASEEKLKETEKNILEAIEKLSSSAQQSLRSAFPPVPQSPRFHPEPSGSRSRIEEEPSRRRDQDQRRFH